MVASRRKRELDMEATSSQSRVDDYFRKNPMTGDPFKDIGGLLATREDRKRAMLARQQMDTEEDRSVTRRGQDIELELGTEKNRLTGRGQDFEKEIEMRKADVTAQGYQQHYDVGMAEVGLNRDVFDMTKQRYEEFGRKGDELALARSAQDTAAGYEEYGLPEGDVMKDFSTRYIGERKKKSTPVGEDSIYFNDIPNPVQDDIPDWLKPADYRKYNTTGIPLVDVNLGALAEGSKSLFRGADAAGKLLDDMTGLRVATPKPVRNSLRARVRKVK